MSVKKENMRGVGENKNNISLLLIIIIIHNNKKAATLLTQHNTKKANKLDCSQLREYEL